MTARQPVVHRDPRSALRHRTPKVPAGFSTFSLGQGVSVGQEKTLESTI